MKSEEEENIDKGLERGREHLKGKYRHSSFFTTLFHVINLEHL
jgi:hypothetical protein